MVEEPHIVMHKAHQPDVLGDRADAELLAGKDVAKVDFVPAEADAPAIGDGDGAIMERMLRLG